MCYIVSHVQVLFHYIRFDDGGILQTGSLPNSFQFCAVKKVKKNNNNNYSFGGKCL